MRQFIKCPQCGKVELAKTKNTAPFPAYFHDCSCGYTIVESDWDPVRALSLRQPWAWLLVHGYKGLENRSTLKNFRGTFLIHASKQWDKVGTSWILDRYDELGLGNTEMPTTEKETQMGGIIGYATITDSITESDSPWFFGPNAFVVENPRILDFIPCKGRLSFFLPKLE